MGANPEEVMLELQRLEEKSIPGTIRFDSWDTTLLSDFIIQHHHDYVKRNIPAIKELLSKVVEAHGDSHSELRSLASTFDQLSEELIHHMNKEEQVLFPEVKRLFGDSKTTTNNPSAVNLILPMMIMEDEHTHAGDLIKSIRSLTDNYTPPQSACPTFRLTYNRLKEFDSDLMQHIHLENNVLFLKVKNRLSEKV